MKYPTQDQKFSIEDNRLVGQSGPVPLDEPLFILRARDINATATLNEYFKLAREFGADHEHLAAVNRAMERFVKFKNENPDRMKVPDTDLTKLNINT